MGDAQAPGGYFVGRPANYEEKTPQDTAGSAPAAAAEKHAQQQEGQAPAPGGQKKTGILGNLCSCFSGGGAES